MWSYKDTFFADENKIAHCPCPRPRDTDKVNEVDRVDRRGGYASGLTQIL